MTSARRLVGACAATLLLAGCSPGAGTPHVGVGRGTALELVSVTEFPAAGGYAAAAVPDLDGRRPVVLYSDDDEGLSAVRATRPAYRVRSLRADRVPLPGLAPGARPAALALDEEGNALAVVTGGPGRLVSVDADGGRTRSRPLTGPLDGRPELVVAAAFAGRGRPGYVARAEDGRATVELTALRDGRNGAQRLVGLDAPGGVRLRGLSASSDGSRLTLAYDDGTTTRLATFDEALRPVSTVPLGAAADEAQVAVDDRGVVHVLRSLPGGDPGSPALRIDRFPPGGGELPPVDVPGVWYATGLALAPPAPGGDTGRWAYVTGMSATTGVLGVFVVDLRTGRTVRSVPLCTDTEDGVIGAPALSGTGGSMTVVGYCSAVDTLWELALPVEEL